MGSISQANLHCVECGEGYYSAAPFAHDGSDCERCGSRGSVEANTPDELGIERGDERLIAAQPDARELELLLAEYSDWAHPECE